MGKYSACVDGKVLDFKYKKGGQAFIYNFYIGDMFLGQIFNMGKTWTAVPWQPRKYGKIDGFKNRYYASQYILQSKGIWE